MTAEIIDINSLREQRPGNGAREALIDIACTLAPSTLGGPAAAGFWSDVILGELWARGFKVVLVENVE
jgi:hypothetical protein